MNIRIAAVLMGFAVAPLSTFGAESPHIRPKSGKVEIMPVSEVKRGMKGIAWTVFQGTEPEAVPVEIIGISKNMWGPKQDIILGKMGGKAARTNVAKGMSGSPVYIDGKLIGAVSLGLSQFSPDAICGITPIELMLDISASDKSRPAAARAPGKAVSLTRGGGQLPAIRRLIRRPVSDGDAGARSIRRWCFRDSTETRCATSAPSFNRWACARYRARAAC